MTSGSIALGSSSDPLHEVFDAILLDLDGVVYVGPDAVPGAAEALAAAVEVGARPAYLTNNASRTAATVAQHLRDIGMPVDDDGAVVTSAQAIAHVMADDLPAEAKVLVVGGEGLRAPLQDRGLICVDSLDDEPVAVVQGYAPGVSWTDLAEASYAIESGLPWYVSNTDLTIPTARGIAPGNGALVHAVHLATGADPVVAGKPYRPLFDETLGRLSAERPLMVGDRLDTDIDGAIGAGIPSLAVLTGISSLGDLMAAPEGRRPDFVGPDLSALGRPHAPVEVEGSSARCGAATATVRDGVIDVGGAGAHDLDSLRAALQLAWSVGDASGKSATPGGTLES